MMLRGKKINNRWFLLWLEIAVMVAFSGHAQQVSKILEITDLLTNSKTVGNRIGGQLTADGWKTVDTFDYIRYDIATCSAGEVEFDVKGFYASNEVFPNLAYDKYGKLLPGEEDVHYAIFNMYDRDDHNSWYAVKQWHNPYKCIMHMYGYTPGDLFKWGYMKLRLNVAAFTSGYDDDPHAFEDPAAGPFKWQRDHVYHHRLVWGEGHMLWYVDDVLVKDWDYSSFGELYAPPDHSIRLGSGALSRSGGYKTPLGITFSNFKFYRYVDITPPTVSGMEPNDIGAGVPVDSDIMITFSESMDAASTVAAFSITPSVKGSLKWVGEALFLQRSELLQPATTYTVQVTTAAMDKAGLHMATTFAGRFTTSTTVPSVVKKYDTFELPLVATGLSSRNRYRDITLQGIFRGPSKTITIEGFWDGGDVWKVRMAPTEVGRWSYEITSTISALRATGSFDCVESDLHGFVRRNPARPYTFMYDDGTPWLWLGDTSWRGYTSMVSYEGRWKPYIDLRAKQGYTAVQSIVVSYINGLNFWKNEGGTCFYEDGVKKDYDQLNPGYFRWIDKRIEYALSKGIVPVILFTWAQEYALFSDVQFEKYVRYLVARYAAKNVIWVLCGEYDEIVADFNRPTSEFERWGKLVVQVDPYDHPISLHPTGRSSCKEFGSQSWLGFIMQQTPYTVRDMRRDRIFNKPVVNAEPTYFYLDQNNTPSRNAIWECITNGGFFTEGFIPTYAPDKGGWDMGALPQEQRWVEILNTFLPNIPWHEMDLRSSWISSGNLIASSGKAYLAYNSTGGSVTINLSGAVGSLPARWLNPRDGSLSETFTVRLGGSVMFTPPFSGDWVLYIGEEIVKDELPPLQPQQLTAGNFTTKSITLKWEQPQPAEDGDVAESYAIFRDDGAITSTTSVSYTDANLHEDTVYNYVVYSVDKSGNRSLQGATGQFRTLADIEPPLLTHLKISALDTLNAYFSEPVDSLSATNKNNYQILQGVPILFAKLLPDRASVQLLTGRHVENKFYSLLVRKILDRAAAANMMGSNNVLSYKFGKTFEVSNLVPSTYQLSYLHVGDEYYMDRTFTLLDIPSDYQNLLWIRTKNNDKQVMSSQFMSFNISMAATIYVGYDASITTLPSWMADWKRTNDSIVTTDDGPLIIYEKKLNAGTVTLGGNSGGSSSSMYVVLIRGDQSVITTDQPHAPAQIQLLSN